MAKNTAHKVRIPDIINRPELEHFTQIPNAMLRNPSLSAKAKGLLCLLLSNTEGWYSYMTTIRSMMKDGEDAIRSGLQELENAGYLLKMRYRNKTSKRLQGTLWIYTNSAGEFAIAEKWLRVLEENNLEFVDETGKPTLWKPTRGNPPCGNPVLRILNKNTKQKEYQEVVEDKPLATPLLGGMEPSQSKERPITPALFDKFWSLYPSERRVDKGKAKTAWDKLCNKPASARPTWKQIALAIFAQRKSERWQDARYIPHPTTWLNQQRWLDDPAKMKNYTSPTSNHTLPGDARHAVDAKRLIRKELGTLANIFAKKCLAVAYNTFPAIDQDSIVTPLVTLFQNIQKEQAAHMTPALNDVLPSPITLIENYLEWIDDQDWLTDKTPKLLNVNHALFQRFCREEAKRDAMNRHPLTGEYC